MEAFSRYSDAELAGLLRDGDRGAFAEIYQRYKALLYVFVLRRLGDREESRDLVSELFLSLWARHGELVLDSSLSGYLYTSARNRVLNVVSHRQVQARYIDSFQDYLDAGVDNTDHLVRNRELSALIDREIAALPAKMREVFLLSRETELSRKEIAEQLGLSEQTVKSHMHHALKILKGRLGVVFVLLFF